MHPVSLVGTVLIALATLACALLLGSGMGWVPTAGAMGLWIVFLTAATLGGSTLLFAPKAASATVLRLAGGATMAVSLVAMTLQLAAFAGLITPQGLSVLGLWPLALTAFTVGAIELVAGHGIGRMPEANV